MTDKRNFSAPADRSCKTCRERRVLCDRTFPICQRCSWSKRECKGYEVRLSWPKATDTGRSIIGKPQRQGRNYPRRTSIHILNVSSLDVEKYYHYLDASSYEYHRLEPTSYNNSFQSLEPDSGEGELFQYFQHTAYRSIASLGYDAASIGNVIMRISVQDSSPSAKGVLKSLLALSSLHRHGLQSQCVEFKIAAIRCLVVATQGTVGTREVIQHIAAAMILCSIEIIGPAYDSDEWTQYLCGVRRIMGPAVETREK
ncbi:hypothetical protein F4679DRAFT_134899 [Xylaria curta]|nr:hypothetical protein F4679DRAFT_134899 [Xylaria curta]